MTVGVYSVLRPVAESLSLRVWLRKPYACLRASGEKCQCSVKSKENKRNVNKKRHHVSRTRSGDDTSPSFPEPANSPSLKRGNQIKP